MHDELTTYSGSCHCGQVTFEARARLEYVVDCNCSVCRKRGALWHPASEANLRVLSGESELALYQFGTHTAKHYFCPRCGVHPFARPRLDATSWVVNVRCLEGVDPLALKVFPFDGQNWEEAAAALRARRGR